MSMLSGAEEDLSVVRNVCLSVKQSSTRVSFFFFLIAGLLRAFDLLVYFVNLQIVYIVFRTSFIIPHNQKMMTCVNLEALKMCPHFEEFHNKRSP